MERSWALTTAGFIWYQVVAIEGLCTVYCRRGIFFFHRRCPCFRRGGGMPRSMITCASMSQSFRPIHADSRVVAVSVAEPHSASPGSATRPFWGFCSKPRFSTESTNGKLNPKGGFRSQVALYLSAGFGCPT